MGIPINRFYDLESTKHNQIGYEINRIVHRYKSHKKSRVYKNESL